MTNGCFIIIIFNNDVNRLSVSAIVVLFEVGGLPDALLVVRFFTVGFLVFGSQILTGLAVMECVDTKRRRVLLGKIIQSLPIKG